MDHFNKPSPHSRNSDSGNLETQECAFFSRSLQGDSTTIIKERFLNCLVTGNVPYWLAFWHLSIGEECLVSDLEEGVGYLIPLLHDHHLHVSSEVFYVFNVQYLSYLRSRWEYIFQFYFCVSACLFSIENNVWKCLMNVFGLVLQ